jgi:hypothetical protein
MVIQQNMARISSLYHASATSLRANHSDFFNTHACFQQLHHWRIIRLKGFLMEQGLLVFVLLAFAGIGVAYIFKPDWLVNRSGVRKGRALLTEWSRLEFQIAGAILVVSAVCVLYFLFRS